MLASGQSTTLGTECAAISFFGAAWCIVKNKWENGAHGDSVTEKELHDIDTNNSPTSAYYMPFVTLVTLQVRI